MTVFREMFFICGLTDNLSVFLHPTVITDDFNQFVKALRSDTFPKHVLFTTNKSDLLL